MLLPLYDTMHLGQGMCNL